MKPIVARLEENGSGWVNLPAPGHLVGQARAMQVQDYVVLAGSGSAVVAAAVSVVRLRSQRTSDRLRINQLETRLATERANRLAKLERYADDTVRWRHRLRAWLLSYVASGAINMDMVDMTTIPIPPDLPTDD